MKYQKSSHATYDVRYHVVWITKYRNPVLTREMQERLKFLLTHISKKIGVVILKSGYEEDHVHLYCRIPLTKPISAVVGYLKGSTSKVLRKEFKEEVKEWYWRSKHLWGVGYFVSSVGEINGDIIARYVENQGQEENYEEEIEL